MTESPVTGPEEGPGMAQDYPSKLYYPISEVAQITGVKPHVLRYWETEFVELRPAKNRAGNRIYKEKDIELINRIKDLLYSKKYTIEGARKFLRQISNGEKPDEQTALPPKESEEIINNIQVELEGILEILDNN